jgi:hypothetical protein
MKEADVTVLLTTLQEEWPILDIVSFNELNIQDKLSDQPYQLVRFQEKLIKEKARMEELLDIKTRLVGQKYDSMRFNNDKSLTTKEIESYYIPRDKDIVKINNAISKQNIIIEYFEACVKAIDKLQWSIKLFMEDRRYSG